MRLRLQALATFLHLDHDIQRIDCFDVSHFQGQATVASCVVFDRNGPSKRDYRRFNILGVTPGDDYAAMEQALLRRFQKSDTPLPDVLIIDGGVGQVGVARRVLTMLNIQGITLLGVSKGPSRKSGWEQLILASGSVDPSLPENSPARHIIQHIRDEAHRFAITAHRQQRHKTGMKDRLEDIPGIGPKRRKALLQRFGSVRELSKASVEELTKVSGISKDLAKRIQALKQE
jgi:excinuclease ABC subunit C